MLRSLGVYSGDRVLGEVCKSQTKNMIRLSRVTGGRMGSNQNAVPLKGHCSDPGKRQ